MWRYFIEIAGKSARYSLQAAGTRVGGGGRILDSAGSVLKVELHAHSADDPLDAIPHTTAQLIDRAAGLGYHALAVTLHDRQLDVRPYQSYAAERGVTLVPGIERTICGKHVLLLNFRRGAEEVTNFDELRALRAREPGLVIAPHPFFPSSTALGRLVHRFADLFDAVEYNAMFTSAINFNIGAERWARTHGAPVVGNGDIHRLRQMGTTYSLIDAEPHADAICDAIRARLVRVVARPITLVAAVGLMAELMTSHVLPAGFWTGTDEPVGFSVSRIPPSPRPPSAVA